MVFRVYTEKRAGYDGEAKALLKELRDILLIKSLTGLRVLNRYDIEGVDKALFEQCLPIVFYEPQTDDFMFDLPETDARVLGVEALPGQFDVRAASCEECVQLVSRGERPAVRTAKIYLLEGEPDAEAIEKIKKYLINPVESREADLAEKDTLKQRYDAPGDVEILSGFTAMDEDQIAAFVREYGLAMDADDLRFCMAYFKGEGRDPSLTEIRMLDTYWSDHCRHTTFLTVIDGVDIGKPAVEAAFKRYLALRKELGRENKPVTLMDIATIGAKALRARGGLKNLDISEEINACSIVIDAEIDGKTEPWLLMFKNETHNHPTEIEPFGGAATCIGGAIRDPLSGRTYVYQAMRVTGAGDPLMPVKDTLPGKLPQRKLVTTAAAGYSSYGNQIGLATGLVDELYHEGYVAKRMEIGAVVGAAPLSHVRRGKPMPGDVVILLGGRTGRDGCGGATGSSKSHKLESLESCGAEVQKGNPVIERKLQRLFRDENVTKLIKRCNDFGAGGVSVAIGELADGLRIDLDKVPRKYEGLDGTELAISESQERMAVVVAAQDAETFIGFANQENLEATIVAEVTEEPRLRMGWRGREIVDIARDFLNSNGAEKHAKAAVPDDAIEPVPFAGETVAEKLKSMVSDLNVCSKQGLAERFDSTIGAASVLMPFGGKMQKTPAQAMAAKLPVERGETGTCSGMAYGFHPHLMAQSPYEGAYQSVAESLCRLAASGFDVSKAYLTFQEYFQRMTIDPETWGKPFAALLGALSAQLDFGVAAVGGKDSMSGTFEDLHVPPTLVSFAVALGKAEDVISPEFKAAGHELRYLPWNKETFMQTLNTLYGLIRDKRVVSAWAVGFGGAAEGLFKMAIGNRIGVKVDETFDRDLFTQEIGSIIIELAGGTAAVGERLGVTTEAFMLAYQGETHDLNALMEAYESKLEPVFPFRGAGEIVEDAAFSADIWAAPAIRCARPRAVIPTFPGTNCEADTARALERAGAKPVIALVNNLTPDRVSRSVDEMAALIGDAQMIVFPGGFSGGDEPDGSGKFITAFFRSPKMAEAVTELLKERDGLILGICNGFQALIKLGLVPYGRIIDTDADCPTLTFNTVGRHQSMLVRTRVASDNSPWLKGSNIGDIHTIPVSHGEGRFVCPDALLASLLANGQIATQYVDLSGNPTMDLRFNPNGSAMAVEGILSPDGRVLGKMAHTERTGRNLYKNVPGNIRQPIFENGVKYFK
ncbi:MAG: phosphoribosylformylglycinamidine synthase [Clostridiales bacterium]|nr:phosphoribosylformylglycinamidine synthase [Clostridiales bacterium]